VINSTLPYLLTDNWSLERYYNGSIPEFHEITRSLLLLKRNENRALPDHHYRLILAQDLSAENAMGGQGLKSIGDLLRTGFFTLANQHLELRGGNIYVQETQQNSWQQLVTFIPPMVLQTAFLHIRQPLLADDPEYLREYFKQYVVPNFNNTALPTAYIPQLKALCIQQSGLHDLHLHLNGSTETDSIWQDYLMEPDKIYKELKAAFEKEEVKEHLIQESFFLSPIKFYGLLLIARKLRRVLFHLLYPYLDSALTAIPRALMLKDILDPFSYRIRNALNHPLAELLWPRQDLQKPMAVEGLMYMMIFKNLAKSPDSFLGSMFHFYLLILGLCNRLLVQQTHQYGLEQFQKHTLNGLREYSERVYLNRFVQMQGNMDGHINFIEGRFSPKETKFEALAMFRAINRGWDKMIELTLEDCKRQNPPIKCQFQKPELRLVGHFIKRKDDNADKWIRFKNLRKNIWKRALVLALLWKNDVNLQKKITGIDAASNEFNTPPEVFAPAFRLLRHVGFRHFTYHAGEDFYHLLSGLRAIYEAIEFTGLSVGDRIGHATATGLSAQQWNHSIGSEMHMLRGERLDDLLFTYYLIVQLDIQELIPRLPAIANLIHEHTSIIYGNQIPVHILLEAWQLRRYCPILASCSTAQEARRKSVYDAHSWQELPRKRTTAAWDILWLYHQADCRKRYKEIISVKTLELFNLEEMELFQKAMLRLMHDREIIIETLPTSNVRIGYYKDYSGYHLWNWMHWAEQGFKVPPVVVGTDDTGIFATNIYNEYANIYCFLSKKEGVSHQKAIDFVKQLDENSRIYRFEV
jgi:adenosine deaminase